MSFDRLAPHYRWMERILAAGKLQECRSAFVEEIRPPARVLLVGEGPGRFLEVVCARFPEAEITVLDSSRGMLKEARRRVLEYPTGIRFEHRDAMALDFGQQKFDMIATHFFLDCFSPEQLSKLIPGLAARLEPGGAWLIADFSIPPQGWQRLRALVIHRAMYMFFRVATGLRAECLTEPDDLLAKSGLHLEKRCTAEWGLLRSDLWRNSAGPLRT